MKHPRQGVLNWFIRQVLDGETISLYGDGCQIRDINFVDDVVDALLKVGISKKGWGEAYNLGGTPLSLIDFVKKIIEIAGKGKLELKPFPPDRKKIEIGDYIASYKKITKTFGWIPKVSVEQGIAMTLDYYRKYKKFYW
jgi:UDP-glucose 4-epimerase